MRREDRLSLLVHVDALRHDYVVDGSMPFLRDLGEDGIVSRVVPPFGFEPDGAYWTGTDPERYVGGAHFVYRGDMKPLPLTRWIPGFLDRSPIAVQWTCRKMLETVIRIYADSRRIRRHSTVARIPLSLLHFFAYCEHSFPHEKGFGRGNATLFDYLNDHNLSFFYHGFPEHGWRIEEVWEGVRSQFNRDARFAFLLIGDLDHVGHYFGPDSDERRVVAARVDRGLAQIYDFLASQYDAVDVLIFGDHGMVPITQYIDLGSVIRTWPLKLGEDFVYFLDSTFARFWFLSPQAEQVIRRSMGLVQEGRVVSDEELREYRIAFRGREFGDLIFWADTGSMIFPDFWHAKRRPVGMHGYRKEVVDNHGAMVYAGRMEGTNKIPSVEMPDLFQTVAWSLFGTALGGPGVRGTPVQTQGT